MKNYELIIKFNGEEEEPIIDKTTANNKKEKKNKSTQELAAAPIKIVGAAVGFSALNIVNSYVGTLGDKTLNDNLSMVQKVGAGAVGMFALAKTMGPLGIALGVISVVADIATKTIKQIQMAQKESSRMDIANKRAGAQFNRSRGAN